MQCKLVGSPTVNHRLRVTFTSQQPNSQCPGSVKQQCGTNRSFIVISARFQGQNGHTVGSSLVDLTFEIDAGTAARTAIEIIGMSVAERATPCLWLPVDKTPSCGGSCSAVVVIVRW